jgi:SAM-dependent methyltransferase
VSAWRRDVESLVDVLAPSAVVVALVNGLVRWRRCDAGTPLLAEAPGGTVRGALPFPDASVDTVVAWLVRDATPAAVRAAFVTDVARVVAPGGVVVAIDHNRPRRLAAALLAILAPPRPPLLWPAAAWRRLAHPTARELRAAGFAVERLSLACRERVQVVVARRTFPRTSPTTA